MGKRQLRTGFTLVEVLVVIVIVGVLMALLLPAVQMARASARTATCANNERQIGIAFRRYLQQNGRAPNKDEILSLQANYAENQGSMYKCPDVTEGTSYGANKFVHQMLDDTFKVILLDAKESPIPFDEETSEEWREKVDPRHSGTFNVLYFDGHVEKQVAFGIDPYIESAKNKWMWEPNRYNKEEESDCPEVPGLSGAIAHFTFDDPADLGGSEAGSSATYNPLKVLSVNDPERCLVAKFITDSQAGGTFDNFRITPVITSGAPEWSIAFWHKNDDTNGVYFFMGYGQGNSVNFWGNRLAMFTNDARSIWLYSRRDSSGNQVVEPPAAISAGTWNHFVFSMSSEPQQRRWTWINGVPFTVPNALPYGYPQHTPTLASTVLNGWDQSPGLAAPGAGKTGHFDDIRFFTRILTDAEATALYEGSRAQP
jgi:prepilin-type N-terminal cleavage/methylation domain-containing protein/prepilin-type processing-associated H-X9-DG protein